MQKIGKIDFAKLLGFETVSDCTAEGIDFRDETIGVKLGAKVGGETIPAPFGRASTGFIQKTEKLDFGKLLGFETVGAQIAGGLDLQDETFGDKLGAKVGLEPPSDVRLKRDIDHLATRCDGLPIYAFKYLWDDEVHVGVMAQDLLRNELWRPAVLTKGSCYFAVDYRRLGLRMTTLDEWLAKGMAAVERPDDN